MDFETCYNRTNAILMEGALGERLKREYGLSFDENVSMASLVYDKKGRHALQTIWKEYIAAAKEHHLPFLATTPTRRTNKERVARSKFDEKIIEDNMHFLMQIKKSCGIEMYAGGLMGCKGNAYQATEVFIGCGSIFLSLVAGGFI